ncbi:MAG TPA: tripartite tricarboxylate transporter substrate binding protein [Burkholderiales bacterium]|jgi:tripartite-type tricarboxylate transporter receptor subunit TctC|nr:tripartite tricarboxylate transporter substrate binding protein [Burkholderiales bacterium]
MSALARTASALFVVQMAVAAAQAQAQTFPEKPIRLIVPFPPGGVTDPVARVVGEKVAQALGQPVIVDNRPGGAGIIGAQLARQAAPDGYTLFMGHSGTHAVNPHLYASLPYDPLKDFQPITLMMSTSHVLVVPEASAAKSVADLARLARSSTQPLTFASQGVGTGGHLLGEMLAARVGATLQHVPYRGSGPALLDLLAGRVDLFFDAVITSAPHVRAGRLRALATASPQRARVLPEVPTMAEAGYSGVELDFWFALFAPAGTPPQVVSRLHEAFVEALTRPEVAAKFGEQGLDILTSSPEELRNLVQSDSARFGRVVRGANVKIQ